MIHYQNLNMAEHSHAWNTMPFVSVVSVGKNRWAWVASKLSSHEHLECSWRDTSKYFDPATNAAGYAPTKDDAIQAGALFLGHDDFLLTRTMWVKVWHDDQVAARRAARPAKTTESAPTEYIYSWHYSSSDDGWIRDTGHVMAWRIVKKTKGFVFIEDNPMAEWTRRGGLEHYRHKTHLSDKTARIPIEVLTEGYVRMKWRQDLSFYAHRCQFWRNPMDAFNEIPEGLREMPDEEKYCGYYQNGKMQSSTPPCIKALGLVLPCTVEQVKGAYRRLAKEYHPDTGGDAVRFVALQASYEQALTYVVGGSV